MKAINDANIKGWLTCPCCKKRLEISFGGNFEMNIKVLN